MSVYELKWAIGILLTLSLAVILIGCVASDPPPGSTVVRNRPGPSFYYHEVSLSDGTRCVISTSGDMTGGTGITCDWSTSNKVE